MKIIYQVCMQIFLKFGIKLAICIAYGMTKPHFERSPGRSPGTCGHGRRCPQNGKKTADILLRTYCGHRGHVTADMSADLSSGVPWCPQVCPQVSAGPKCPQCPQIFCKKLRTSAAMSFTNNGSAGAPIMTYFYL